MTLSFRISSLQLVSHDGEPDVLEATLALYEVGPDQHGRVTELDGWSVVVTCTQEHAHSPACVRALMEDDGAPFAPPAATVGRKPGARSLLLAERAAAAAARRARTRVATDVPVSDAERILEESVGGGV